MLSPFAAAPRTARARWVCGRLGVTARRCERAVWFAAALTCAACSSDAPTPVGDSAEGAALPLAAETAAPPAATEDRTAPAFDGIQSVELIGERTYRVTWEPGRDDVTRTPLLSYQVAHLDAAWGQPDAATRPVGASLQGETSLELELSGGSGRFFVRAVDQAGNASQWGTGLAQASERPWLLVPEGTRTSRVRTCEGTVQGQALCAGEDGHAARWIRDRWVTLPTSPGVDLRIARGDSGLLLYSTQGHLYEVPNEGPIVRADVSFDGEPSLPFRQFVSGPTGLRYWIDADGTTWISATASFRRMRRPLAIPDAECARLQGMQFADVAGVAVCENGAVHSVSTERAGMRWLPLTADAPYELPNGMEFVVAESDASVVVLIDNELFRVGVGGWTSLWEASGRAAPPRRSGRPVSFAGRTWVPTSAGLFELVDERLTPVAGAEGDLVAVATPGPLESQDTLTLLYRDGGVATWQRGRRTWRTESPPSGFVLGAPDGAGGVLALTAGERAGVWRWSPAGWSPLSRSLPPTAAAGSEWRDLAWMRSSGVVVLAGEDADGPALWELRGTTWTRARWLAPAPPPPPPRGLAPDAEPPIPPLAGIPVVRAEDAVVPDGPFVGLSTGPGGRVIAHTEHQVWWRLADGWLPLHTFDEPLLAATPDAGESWVAVTPGGVTRCWRERCDDSVAPSNFAPDDVVTVWENDAGLLALLVDGTLSQFVPEIAPELEGRARPGPDDLPAGGWVDLADSLPATMSGGVVQRLVARDIDVVLRDDGTVWTREDETFTRQGRAEDAIRLVAADDTWAVLTSRGLLRLGDVPIARRSAP